MNRRSRPDYFWNPAAIVFAFAFCLADHAADSARPRLLHGTYRNRSFNVDGAGGAQRSMAPLILFADDRYTWGQETGRWSLQNGSLRLSERPAWGNAAISRDGELIFEFKKEGRRYTVTMYRAGDVPATDLPTARKEPEASAVRSSNPVPSYYENRKEHDPDGIGKFYMGREIAHVMGHQAADWLERPERETEERPDLVVEALRLKPGDAVADIGAGTGYFSWRMAKAVGERGLVYAVDIQKEMLDLLAKKMAGQGITNVKGVLGSITDPNLPARSADVVLMVDVYHEFDHPLEMMEHICQALKPGGRVVFVEYRAEDPTVPIKRVHKMSEAQLRQEMSVHPLEWVETVATLPRQHIMVFRKKG